MNILIVIEDNNGAIHKMSLEAIVAAQEISSKLNAKTMSRKHTCQVPLRIVILEAQIKATGSS